MSQQQETHSKRSNSLDAGPSPKLKKNEESSDESDTEISRPPEDVCDDLAKLIVMRLNSLNKRQKIITEKQVLDILYRAQCGVLDTF